MTILGKGIGVNVEAHSLLEKITPLQAIIFVFIYASIAEEFLFRGFLLNILKPLHVKGLKIFGRKISFSVIISAIAFGLAHLILISSGAGGFFVLRIVAFTATLSLIAGYYQEKYDNNVYAIIVHMSGNLIGVVGSILSNIKI